MNIESQYIFIILILCNFFIYLNLDKLSKILNIYDYPDNLRKIHKKPVPLIGGSIFLLNIIFFIIFDFFFNEKVYLSFLQFNSLRETLVFFLTTNCIFIIGIYDDKFNINALLRLALMLFFSYFYLLFSNQVILHRIDFIDLDFSFSFGPEKLFITLMCIITLINILNFYDGINLELVIYCLLVFIFLLFKTQNELFLFFIIPLIFVGYLNYKNKLFLGDNGAYLLGFIISVLLLKSYNNSYIPNALEIFAIVSLPFFDSLRVILKRIALKKKIYEADKTHIHHILYEKFGQKKSIKIMFLINFITFIFLYFNYLLAILFSFLVIFLSSFFLKKNFN